MPKVTVDVSNINLTNTRDSLSIDLPDGEFIKVVFAEDGRPVVFLDTDTMLIREWRGHLNFKQEMEKINTESTSTGAFEVEYFGGLVPIHGEIPFNRITIVANKDATDSELIRLGLQQLKMYPRSYHAKVTRLK
jgi:hypothetical protein